ncbi:DUF6776 family protein [Dyella sp.]|jgi:hypothetical protein|uniref:DUF6776 family protein n=1 Tax=Dyella sp. TaxID=1869338 RepID=UPI002D78FE0B|nr:DUF6776 family protein [Dyella sp.]HET6431441.1 DUF6776 family protein [Dyella sp.]
MPPRPPPRFVVQTHDTASDRRRRLWVAAGWPLTLLLAALFGFWLAQRPVTVLRRSDPALKPLRAENDQLKQQVADLQRSQQVNEVAMRSLQGTLTEREEQISGLRADLGFYSRLVGGEGQRQGLRVQEVRVQPVSQSHAWNLTISLTQNVRRGDETTGKAIVTVEGLRQGKVEQLPWSALGDAAQKDGLPFHFRYFQQVHCTFVLPPDFRPMRLRIQADPDSGTTASRTVAWNEALNSNITNTQGDQDAQP